MSEIMLQQTQVDRVIPKYTSFIRKFGTVQALAGAPLGEVLQEWQGLGYNRRAKMLHETAKEVLGMHAGKIPRTYAELVALPGIGDYTAKAVRVFAWGEPEVLIETNVRSVFLHHFFQNKTDVPDKKLLPYIKMALDTKNPRGWYSALMDYGSYLKKTIPNPSRYSAHHTKQKPFKGSNREVRGAILRLVSQKPSNIKQLLTLSFEDERINLQLKALIKEGFIKSRGSRYQLSD